MLVNPPPLIPLAPERVKTPLDRVAEAPVPKNDQTDHFEAFTCDAAKSSNRVNTDPGLLMES